MRKRSSYRPKHILQNPIAWVMEGFRPARDYTDVALNTRLRNHMALQAVIEGNATPYDLGILINMSNMAMALSRTHGADWKAELVAAANAIEAMQLRHTRWGKVQATPTELEVIMFMTRIHDKQIDAARVKDVDAAVAVVRKEVSV